MTFLTDLKAKIKANPFRYIILLLTLLLFISLLFVKNAIKQRENSPTLQTNNELIVFIQDACGHCEEAELFLSQNAEKYKDIDIVFYNLKDRESQVFLFQNVSKLQMDRNSLGTPIFIMNDEYIVGFGEKEQSKLKQLLKEKKIKRNN